MVALIAGWVTTEVGRQPWVVFRVMRTAQAVTAGSGIAGAYAVLAALYAALAVGVWWVLRRLSRTPLGPVEPAVAVLAPAGFTRAPRRGRRPVTLDAYPLILIVAGLTAYGVLGGADFGAGFWSLLGGPADRAGKSLRDHAHHAIGPVWEANHVWLIFVLVVCWTGYPTAFGSIVSTLAVPLFIAAVGIILRGTAYALRAGTGSAGELRAVDLAFALSSIIVPFAFGAAIGGIASGRVPVGNAAGDQFTSWANWTSFLIGVLAVAVAAYLAAVYLAADGMRLGEPELAEAFRVRALAMGVVAGPHRDGRPVRRPRRRAHDLRRAHERMGPRRGGRVGGRRVRRRWCSSGCAATARRARPPRPRSPPC